MLMAGDSSNFWSFDNTSAADDDFDGLSIDLDSLMDILGEGPDSLQNRPEDSSLQIVPHGESASDFGVNEHSMLRIGLPESEGAPSLGAEVPGSVIFFPSFNSEASDSRTGGSDGSFESGGNSAMLDCTKLEPLAKISSPVHSCSGSLTEWMSPVRGNGASCADRDGVCQNASSYIRDDIKEYQFEIPNCSATFSFAAGDAKHASDIRGSLDSNNPLGEAEFQFRRLGGSTCSNYLSHNRWMENSDINHRTYFDSGEDSFQTSGTPGMEGTYIMDVDTSFQSVSHNQSSLCEFPDILYATGDQYSAMPYCSTDDSFYFGPLNLPENIGLQSMLNNDEVMVNIKDEGEELPTQNAFLNDRIFKAKGDIAAGTVSEALLTRNSGIMGLNANCDGSNLILPTSGDSSDKSGSRLTVDKASIKFLPRTLSNMPSKKQEVCIKNEKNDEQVSSQGTACRSFEAMDDVVSRKSSAGTDGLSTKKGLRPSLSGILTSISSKKHVVAKGEKEDVFLESKRSHNSLDNIDETCKILTPISDNRCLDVKAPKQPCLQPSTIIRKQFGCPMEEKESKLTQSKSTNSLLSKVCHQSVKSNAWVHRSQIDDDSDICILEDLNEPARQNLSTVNGKPAVTEICSSFNDPPPIHSGVGSVRLKTNDERFIFRVALQDLSQPKSESTPPEGVLAVPLLRHQRIALSWMVQMETTSVLCSGGILADDQGLGKTISTIALILKERSPSSSVCTIGTKKSETETLNLDEDDDSLSELDGSKKDAESCQVMENGGSTRGRNTSPQAKGRPAAGTLVVCPTSVLRQWYEELRNKVTSKANLSVLLYHGSNRTRDPFELAKYDVVLTTYSIVSMEVPKQPLVDEDDDEPGKRNNVPPMGLPSSKKRKYPPSSDKRSLKGKKGMDSELFESVARPLARVGWFRVVLDEAQSIKNHRTQVARACWGLRAKRRWCLSGTPIQNAVDDLYSYFRFLRYDPYAAYKKFCSTIKVPIHRNPANGYRKLQAVLKTIMLRRTKGTLLDGEPIINLPPKTIELKKVDFTMEEREFYCRLEADSRAQFAEYAAAGTVKQNYVNILLMLLRLRQACDHPLLVRGCGASSVWRSSVETAKKLPREKQICLLNCLEASLAICGLCNDPPEDAVVTSCEHVFCNQCICEHLTGEDNQCPTANCKARLTASSVFSSTTLRSSLSDQPGQESSFDRSGSGSVLAETLEPCSSGGSFDSSKIKAALEVLQSLSRPRDFSTSRTSSLISSIDGSACCPENSSHPLSEELHMNVNRNLDSDGGSNDLVSVVGEKAIVFSQWTRMLDLLEACLKNSSIQYRRLDGTMSVVARDKAVKDFNTLPEVSVMIMSLKAASLGLNMVAACHVLLLDLWWNPTTEDQAIDRAHRIGQTRPVTVLRLTVKDTVEDRILALQQKKREMVSSAFGEDETGSRQTRLTVEDLKYLFMA